MSHWRKKVEALARDVLEVMKSERLEKEARQAEMLASKAQNMMDHAEEIYNRPEKKWFQTAKEKKAVLDAAHEESTGRAAPETQQRGRKGQIVQKKEHTKPGKGELPKPKLKNMSRAQRREKKFGIQETAEDIDRCPHTFFFFALSLGFVADASWYARCMGPPNNMLIVFPRYQRQQKVGKAAAKGTPGQRQSRPSAEKKPVKKRKREEASLEDRIVNSKAKPSAKHRDAKVHITKGGRAKPEFMSKGMKKGRR